MKKRTKIISTILASALGVFAATGGLLMNVDLSSAGTNTTYLAGDIFTGTNATLDVSGDAVRFRFKDTSPLNSATKDEGTMAYAKRSVALAWQDGGRGAEYTKYFSTKFSFVDTNFEEVSMVMESKPSVATKDDKAINKVVFFKDADKVKVSINPADETAKKAGVEVDTTKSVQIAFSKDGCDSGEYAVVMTQDGVSAQTLGKFTNIAGSLAEYVAGKIAPLSFTMKLPARANATDESPVSVMQFEELNGQSFTLNDDDQIVDNAKPVVVIGEEISPLQLGKNFSVDVKVVDVLDDFPIITKQFYQFNPNDFDETDEKLEDGDFHTLATSTTFKEMQYTKDGKTLSVFNDYNGGGKEYVAIRYFIEDEVHYGDTKAKIDLSWYAADDAYTTLTEAKYSDDKAVGFISMDKSKEGPEFSFLSKETDDKGTTETTDDEHYNKFDDSKQGLIDAYQTLVDEAAEKLFVGTSSSAYIYLPSLEGLISDNDGYKNLQFAISYKKQGNTTNSSVTGLDFNAIKFSVSEVGMYEFKIYATDNAENKMKYYLDGEEVALTGQNVWKLKAKNGAGEEVDAIPSFKFEAKPTAMKVESEEESDRKVTKVLDDTYTLNEFQILGLEGEANEKYGLYRVNVAAVNAKMGSYISNKDLYAISYDDLTKKAQEVGTGNIAPEDEAEFFLKMYVKCLAEKLSLNADTLWSYKDDFFTEIQAYDSRINETDHPEEFAKNNKFNWTPDGTQSFKTVEEGTYLIVASFTNPDVNAIKAGAYKVVFVQEEADVLPGEDNWVQNNLASIILFSVAGVMLIVIIALLFIKTDDKTLADVDKELDENGKPKKGKKAKKAKKSKDGAEPVADEKQD